MRLVFTTDEFIYARRARPGFPLLLGADMRPIEPFQSYLQYRLLGAGKALDLKSWEAYGRRLWDYVSYLHANGIAWNGTIPDSGSGPIATYRDWSLNDLGLKHSTINSRLAVAVHFYEWAKTCGLVDAVPFEYEKTPTPWLSSVSVDDAWDENTRANVMLTEWEAEPAFLSAGQLRQIIELPLSPTRRLLFGLMRRVGLRSCEARTFPHQYVFNPSTRRGLRKGQMIDVELEPNVMEIKYDKPRVVHVPYSLMQDMFSYTQLERNRLKPSVLADPSSLLLTVKGSTFSKDAVVHACGSISARVGFRFTALTLRHSYAVHTLARLRCQPDFKGDPLMYVRDRLGHESVETTMVYLDQIERLSGAAVLEMQNEFDELFADVQP